MAEAQPEQSQKQQPDINQAIDQVLRDGRVSKEELQKLSDQYQSQIDNISDETKTKSQNLMKESLTSILNEYTINDADDLAKLQKMITDLGMGYTIDPSVDPTQRHIKVRLVDSVIRPVGAWHGWFTPENQGSLSITDILSYRKDQHISNAISSGYYPTHRDTVGALREYFVDKLGDMNAAMHSDVSNPTYDSAEEAYQSIIYTITHGGDMHRPSKKDREEIHFRSAKDVEKAQKYLEKLISEDIREEYKKETQKPSITPTVVPIVTPTSAPSATPASSVAAPASSAPSTAPASSTPALAPSPEVRKGFDNAKFFNEHKTEIEGIILDSTNPLKPLLDAYKKKQSYNNIVAIQTELKKGTHALVVDGDFGENTLEALLEQTTADSTIESAPSAAGNKDSAEKPVTSNETLFKTGTTLVYSDGAYHLVGPKGKTTLLSESGYKLGFQLPEGASDNLKQTHAILSDLTLLVNAYQVAYPKQSSAITQVMSSIEKFSTQDVLLGKEVIDIKNSVASLNALNIRHGGRGTVQITNPIQDLFKEPDAAKRHMGVLRLIRDELDQSDIVAQDIVERNKDKYTITSDAINANNLDSLDRSIFTNEKKSVIEKAINTARSDATSNWNEHQNEYLQNYCKENSMVMSDITDKQRKDCKDNYIDGMTSTLGRREIFRQALYNKDLSKGDPQMQLLQDILGAGTWDISDDSKRVGVELSKMVAMEAIALAVGTVTAGVGTYAINAMMFGSNAIRGAKALNAYSKLSHVKQIGATGARIGASGAGFELGHANAVSQMQGDGFTGGTMEGYAQSVVMMGALHGVEKLIQSGKIGSKIQFKSDIPAYKQLIPLAAGTVLDAAAISATTGGVGVMFGREENWTGEQIAQALIMASFFRGAKMVMVSHGPKGEIQAKEVVDTPERIPPHFGSENVTPKYQYSAEKSQPKAPLIKKPTETTIVDKGTSDISKKDDTLTATSVKDNEVVILDKASPKAPVVTTETNTSPESMILRERIDREHRIGEKVDHGYDINPLLAKKDFYGDNELVYSFTPKGNEMIFFRRGKEPGSSTSEISLREIPEDVVSKMKEGIDDMVTSSVSPATKQTVLDHIKQNHLTISKGVALTVVVGGFIYLVTRNKNGEVSIQEPQGGKITSIQEPQGGIIKN